VTALDVVYALKRQGRTIYGFGGWSCIIVVIHTPFLPNSCLN
jgi:hypothetical protein